MSARVAAIGLAAALVLPAPGWAQQGPEAQRGDQQGQTFGIDDRILGQIGGALGGALLGSQVGDGKGQVAATAVGGILGYLLGGEVVDRLSPPARQEVQRAERQALDSAPIGQPVSWRSPVDEDVYGTVTPLRQERLPDGRLCREFEQVVYIGGEAQRAIGTACRNPDGTWSLVGTGDRPLDASAPAETWAGPTTGGTRVLVDDPAIDRLSDAAREEVRTAERRALEEVPIGESVLWQSPNGDAYGAVTAVRQGWTADGRPCREVRQVASIEGSQVQTSAAACREADGTWVLVGTGDRVPEELFAAAPDSGPLADWSTNSGNSFPLPLGTMGQ